MRTNVRASIHKSDELTIMHPYSDVKYNTPLYGGAKISPQLELPMLLRWAKSNPDTAGLYKEYVNADSSLFHNLGKKNHSDSKAINRMSAITRTMQQLYAEATLLPKIAELQAELQEN